MSARYRGVGMRFSNVFSEFTEKCGLGAPVQADGEKTLLFDGIHVVTFQCNKEDHSVILSSEICDAAQLAEDEWEMLLEASLLGAQTGGAAFAVSRKLGKVVLWKRHDDAFEDVVALEKAVNTFLAAVITWSGRLASSSNIQVYA